MKLSWITRPLQISAVASAMLLVLAASAQTPATDMPPTPAAAAAPAAQSTPTAPRMHQRPQRAEHRTQRHHKPRQHRNMDGQEPANAASLATSSQNYGPTDYERNAFARCEVFKVPEDRAACVKRLQQMPQGSVEGGGLLREYTYEVPANGS